MRTRGPVAMRSRAKGARAPHWLSLVVTASVLALAVGLAVVSSAVLTQAKHRLLARRAQEAATSIGDQVRAVQSQLVDAVDVANATGGDAAAFVDYASSKLAANGEVASMSLWRLHDGVVTWIASAGAPQVLVRNHRAARFLAGVRPSSTLYVTGILDPRNPQLGYAAMPPDDASGLLVYAERQRPLDLPRRSSPFGRFALYLGREPTRATLLEATGPAPFADPIEVPVRAGDQYLTLVGGNPGQLVGWLFGAFPWIVLGVGAALAVASGGVFERMLRRRRYAELLAGDNERLFLAQRDIASDLQLALLPAIPSLEGLEIVVRYRAGVDGTQVGGDWYDVVPVGDKRCFLVVGDVSGRGLEAAATMASLRFALRAYAAQGDDVETALAKLGSLLEADGVSRLATVLVAEADVPARRVTLASAGHLPPLLVAGGEAEYVRPAVGAPVGVPGGAPPASLTIDVPERATLIGFTDGLVERRHELLDVGLERVRRAAGMDASSLDELVDGILAAAVPAGSSDDTLVMAVRWRS